MAADNDSAPRSERRARVPLPIWVLLGVALVLAFASLLSITHHTGVPTLSPGEKGSTRASSTSAYEAAGRSGLG